MSVPLRHSPQKGRAVRTGTWYEQSVSTYRLAAQAVREERWSDAADLGRFTLQEAREGRQFYPLALLMARSFLLREGLAEDALAVEEARIAVTLQLPDGTPFDMAAGWAGYSAAVSAFVEACAKREAQQALALLEQARQTWRQTHDRACDWLYGLISVCARALGEERVGDLWRALLAPFANALDRYDSGRAPWRASQDTLLAAALESLRGHLSGPGRLGDVEVAEEADRWVLSFNPCGSGGRTYRDDPDEGTPPRMEPPYNYAVTTSRHDWAWNTTGVCLYCAHCCQLQQRMPIERLGYPLWVIEPPRWPAIQADTRCTWSLYKDPTLVPKQAYAQVGKVKPQ